MGHAEHFLRRLDRLSDPHVELALRLYNDPDLLGVTLARAKLPESADRLAIALEHPREGPFLVVTRTGRFVTCLARGMDPHDTPIVTREQLDGAAREVGRMRETLSQSHFFDANKGLLRAKFRALYDAGPYASREQFEDVARWEPLLGPMCLATCVAMGNELLEQRALLKNITRPHPRHEEVLHAYYSTFYACAHLYVLSGISPASRTLLAELVSRSEEFTFAWTGIRHGVGYLLYRALWATGRMGKVLLPGQKRRLRGRLTRSGLFDAMLGTAMIGLAHEKLRAEARKALRGPRNIMVQDPRSEPTGKLLDKILDVCFDDPATAHAVALHLGQRLFWRAVEALPAERRVARPEDAPAETAYALHVSVVDSVLASGDHVAIAFWVLPWLARAAPADLYVPGEIIELIRRPFSIEATIALLDYQRQERGVRKPRAAEKTPSRNDACPCGSGKKYKRCCGK